MSHNAIVWDDVRLIRQILICNQLADAAGHKKSFSRVPSRKEINLLIWALLWVPFVPIMLVLVIKVKISLERFLRHRQTRIWQNSHKILSSQPTQEGQSTLPNSIINSTIMSWLFENIKLNFWTDLYSDNSDRYIQSDVLTRNHKYWSIYSDNNQFSTGISK